MPSKSPIFNVDDNSRIEIRPDCALPAKYPQWLIDSLGFSQECLPAMQVGSGPVVLSGLPVDFSMALALASWCCGRVVAFADPELSENQQQAVVNTLQPGLWVTTTQLKARLTSKTVVLNIEDETDEEDSAFELWLTEEAQRPMPPAYRWHKDETAIVLFTSGSTGLPKGVCHSLHNMLFSAGLFQQQFNITDSDKILNLAPLSTMSGLRCSMFLPLLVACDVNLEGVPGQLAPMLRILSEHHSTVLIVGPVLLQALAGIDQDIPALRELSVILSTGAGLSRAVRCALWQKLNVPILDYYGLTETCGLVIAESQQDYNPEQKALGKSCGNVNACVVDADGNESSVGQGELRIYSEALFLGYWGQSLKRSAYFDTRDQVEIDLQGGISYLGRMDRAVKSAATTWLQPQAVEQWLADQSSIVDFAVTTSDSDYGTVIRCYIVAASTLSDTVLLDGLVNILGNNYNQTQWCQVEQIPRTALGKIKWTEMQ